MLVDIQHNLAAVQDKIAAAVRQAGRAPESVRLVAVTKTFPAESAIAAYRAGIRDLAENRVEEGRDKIPAIAASLPPDAGLRWHLIGHLQRRKAREAVELFDMVQSVDSVRLAETLNRHATELGKRLSVLIQVNVAQDPNKFGFQAEPRAELFQAVAQILALPALRVQGLMTIGALVADPEQARPFFSGLRALRDELARNFPNGEWGELSMGMTDDFPVAIAEGATIVRIGRAIFGERT
ncbi:MAG: YggS family pyridoxal phosphate-dependent enzyme [Anaerolineae bacterium]